MNAGTADSFNYEFQIFEDEEEETFLVVSIVPENNSKGSVGQQVLPKTLPTSHSSTSLDSTGSQCSNQSEDDDESTMDVGMMNPTCARCEGEEDDHLWLRDPWYMIQKKGHCFCYEREEERTLLTAAHKQEWLYNLIHFPEKLKNLSSANRNRFNVKTLSSEMKEELKQLYVY